ncbi:hypothetical protein BSK59_13105 [Paenibacillus odorifer]|uniref:hypothetical protein n=1 Tax=Paenibacillus odorifer TaxID=189426 RepID=UPI00096D503C|nr:hypothetical protein [Paenibacillus odorifer]OME55411.1 hypothetical protein BSK59_13105 [Paenibacillus odorifer]
MSKYYININDNAENEEYTWIYVQEDNLKDSSKNTLEQLYVYNEPLFSWRMIETKDVIEIEEITYNCLRDLNACGNYQKYLNEVLKILISSKTGG